MMVLEIFLGLLLAKLLSELWLDSLNLGRVRSLRGKYPAELKGIMESETFDKAMDYSEANLRFSRLEGGIGAVMLGLILGAGVLAALHGWLLESFGSSLWAESAAMLLALLLLGMLDWPLDAWRQFKLEARFGFNRMGFKLWLTDRIKGMVLGLLLGIPILTLLLWIMYEFTFNWWIFGSAALFLIQLLLLVLYPILIIPLFNKLEPLEEGALRDRLLAMAKKANFPAADIQVMDGSKRSSHSNAYFTGFGKMRRIVLYDTLIEQLEPEELEAVLAHEIGHYRLRHIPQRLVVAAVSLVGGFYGLHWLANYPAFTESFGFVADATDPAYSGLGAALLVFMMAGGLVTFWVSPLSNALSRKHEYEADAFAVQHCGRAEPLIGALRTLYEKNLGNPLPHPLYSTFHHSHPTLLERESAMRAVNVTPK